MTQHRPRAGFGPGVVATIAMSALVLLALVAGKSPMPQPVPEAVVTQLFGSGVPKPALMALAIGLHLGYGGVFGAVLAWIARQVTIWKGLILGVGLWVPLQVIFPPFLGGDFSGRRFRRRLQGPRASCSWSTGARSVGHWIAAHRR